MVNILSSFLRAIITVIFCSGNFTYTYILWKPLLIKIPVFHSQINNAIKLTILLYITVRPPFDLMGWKTPKNIKISENNQHLAHSWLAYKIQKKLVSICTKLSHKTRIIWNSKLQSQNSFQFFSSGSRWKVYDSKQYICGNQLTVLSVQYKYIFWTEVGTVKFISIGFFFHKTNSCCYGYTRLQTLLWKC